MKKLDLCGEIFGQLTVIKQAGILNGGQSWLCRCKCGVEITATGGNLRSGHTKSCGCLRKDGTRSITHGQTHTDIYNTWNHMKGRATGKGSSETRKKYKGVTICDEWKSFTAFYDWAKDKYAYGLQIDRINTTLGYYPDNCRFVTQKKNMQNRKDAKTWVVGGREFHSCSDAAVAIGCSASTIKRRCDGRIDRGKHYPSFPNYHSVKKYQQEEVCQ